jgi:hypothetical protein
LLKEKLCSCHYFLKNAICAHIVAASEIFGIDLNNENLELMLEMSHEFARKVKRGRAALAEKALIRDGDKVQKKSSKEANKKRQKAPKK